ncbi:MAG: hypothetical protein GY754_41165 [bacterium]|nr:hypothetical protein [bacterium]
MINEIEVTVKKFSDMFLSYYETVLTKQINTENNCFSYDRVNVIEEYLYHKLYNSTDHHSTCLVWQLDEFKSKTNLFGIELKVYFLFDRYQYKILYTVAEYNELKDLSSTEYILNIPEPILINYYHDALTKDEIHQFCGKAGKDILLYIKQQNLDPNANFITIDSEILWGSILHR